MEKICVAVRVRPRISEDSFFGNFWKVEENRISLHKVHGTPVSAYSYAFDHIFDERSTNASVYDLLTKDIIDAAVEGFNGTAFAYGQTSSGKTYTMNGSQRDPGIIPRAVEDIFRKIQMVPDREFLIRVSYMEIYNEEINDLLVVENQKLQVHESLERGIFVAGLREEIVNNAEQVLNLIKAGEVNRHFGETNMNARSSRSHTIFRMVIESKGKDPNSCDYLTSDAVRVSVLNLVDLAGSERIAKTGAGGVRLKEGKHINKSLMILGNVINKLSEGSKQRGHIPYRDSKLTRILQPALGGNAKTSIICTIAPEEIHIEETKGTLQFASRATRITNCVQVNEILTDAALLKRQKLEIEELRKKLQGSHAEVLEQEILKLRNDMLKYELEREKLEMELEEERKSRDLWIREKQMKVESLSGVVSSSDCERNRSQTGQDFSRQGLKEECNEINSTSQGDIFRTPCLKAPSNAFVATRSNYSTMPDYSPLPDAFSNVADENTWLKLNKGYVADLDSLQATPARKVQSFPTSDITPGCLSEKYEQEVQDLKRQLELANRKINELERMNSEGAELNKQSTSMTLEYQREARLIGEDPRRLSKSVGNFKDNFEEALSVLQRFVSDGKLSAAEVLSTMTEIGAQLFATLEAHFTGDMDDGRSSTGNGALIHEQQKRLHERLNTIITSLESSESTITEKEQERGPFCRCKLKEKLCDELNSIKERCRGLEEEVSINNCLLEVSKDNYNSLEREFLLLKEERDSLILMVSESSQRLEMVSNQKENTLKDLNTEVQRRIHLEGEVKQFTAAFASRQRSLMSFHDEFRTTVEKLRAQTTISVPKSLGCRD
ncbi:kinesin-like protein KIN-7N isoform X2 [Prosopis cineraria]|uniref:kinesin-like protein KIN-7N isoform X2 n=1 Tax=Prosopis cineraria TaxID=364024 RepID=UPI00240EC4CF|nr:kinesin-like protein KIN-7N isoform X2 [Prosopis cineraria]